MGPQRGKPRFNLFRLARYTQHFALKHPASLDEVLGKLVDAAEVLYTANVIHQQLSDPRTSAQSSARHLHQLDRVRVLHGA